MYVKRQVEGRKIGVEKDSAAGAGGGVDAGRICEAVEKFTRSDGDVWRLCVRDLLSSEVEARSHSIPVLLSPLASSRSHPGFLVDVLITAALSVC